MGFLYPAGLALLGLIPVLVAAYMLSERPRQLVVSSVLAFRALRLGQARRHLGRVRFNWTLLVETALLLLAALALAQPYYIKSQRRVAVVLDNSGVMQALMPSGTTAFESAKTRVLSYFSGTGEQISLYLTAPTPRQVGTAINGVSNLRDVLDRLRPVDAAEDLDAVARFLTDLVNSRRYDQIVVVSRHELRPVIPEKLVALTVGGPIANYALGSFVIERKSFISSTVDARLTVANFTTVDSRLRVTIRDPENRILAQKDFELGPNTVSPIKFENLTIAPFFRATMEPEDRFPLDNTVYGVPPSSSSAVRILFVSPYPDHAISLEKLPGITITVKTPDKYAPSDAAANDLLIFEYGAPKEFPACNALLVMPPSSTPPFNFDAHPASNVEFLSWEAPQPLTDGVNFRMLKFHVGEFFGPHPWMRSVAEGSGGSLILTGEREGRQYVALGFELFPYMGKQNLPMSVLTLNVLSYLSHAFASSTSYRAGLPWRVPSGVERIILPSGKVVSVKPGVSFEDTFEQGIYELVGATKKEFRAVNFDNLTESNLLVPAPIEVSVSNSFPPSTGHIKSQLLAEQLVFLILVLAALEAVLVYLVRGTS